jgi:hypothetical protein
LSIAKQNSLQELQLQDFEADTPAGGLKKHALYQFEVPLMY